MKNSKIKSTNGYIFYLLALVCLFAVTFFTRPHIDEYIFAQSTEMDFNSIWNYCLNYGNGRLLGNIICILFSHMYVVRFMFISSGIIILAILINKILFESNIFFFVPIFLLILYPSKLMFVAVYRNLPSFINYAVPVILCFFSLTIIGNLKKKEFQTKKIYLLKLLILSLVTFSACLFSENTTIVIVVSLVFGVVNNLIFNKKIHIVDVTGLVFSLIGSLVMYLIPQLSQTQNKLDSYRDITVSMDDIIYNLTLFASRISSWTGPLLILSFVLCFVVIKTKKFTVINAVKMAVLATYPFVSIFNVEELFDRFRVLIMTFVYAVAVILSIIDIKNKKTRLHSLEWCFLICCSIAPMLVIKLIVQLGNRLNYFCYILILVFALYLLKKELLPEIKLSKDQTIKRFLTVAMAFVMVFMTAFLTVSNLKDYVDYLGENIEEGEQIEITGNSIVTAIKNKNYLDPNQSALWPKDTWLVAVK